MPLLHVGVGGPTWLDWSVHLDAILLTIALAWGYYYAVTGLRPRVSDAGRVRRSQVVYFSLGLLSLYLAGGTPLHDLGEERLLSAHMLQHLLFTLAAPPFLIAGIPTWLWEWLLLGPRVRPLATFFTRPLVAFAVFNAVVLLTHLPPTVELALRVGAFHFLVHVTLVVTALMMWWPILSPLPQLARLTPPLQMGYLFLQSLLPSVMASFITFADRAVYPFYANAPRIWGISPVADQQIAGGLMKIGGSIVLWSFMAVVFFKWYAREKAEEEGPRWEEIEAELGQLGIERR